MACNKSVQDIDTLVLPNRPADNEAGGSGAVAAWAGPIRHCTAACRAAGPVQAMQVCYAHESSQYTRYAMHTRAHSTP